MIDKNKTYRTRDGREVRIYAVDGLEPFSVHGAMKGGNRWVSNNWTSEGFHMPPTFCNCDLVEVKPRIKRTVWLNIYPESFVYSCESNPTREGADLPLMEGRIACICVEIDCEEGEGL